MRDMFVCSQEVSESYPASGGTCLDRVPRLLGQERPWGGTADRGRAADLSAN